MTKNTGYQSTVRKTVIWLLLTVTLLYLISGFGITEFRTVETLTFGLLSKNLAFRIHNNLWSPFLILLLLHICLPFVFRRQKKRDSLKRNGM